MFCDRGGAVVESRKRGMRMQDRYLFRGKRIDNGEWVHGYLFDDGFENGRVFIGGIVIEKYNGTACDDWNVTGINFYEIDPNTICQCTGLKDKNGKLIWENDIIKAWSQGTCAKGKIKQRIDGTWIMYPAWQKGEMWYLFPDNNGETTVEVIGNVFDNPELLEV